MIICFYKWEKLINVHRFRRASSYLIWNDKVYLICEKLFYLYKDGCKARATQKIPNMFAKKTLWKNLINHSSEESGFYRHWQCYIFRKTKIIPIIQIWRFWCCVRRTRLLKIGTASILYKMEVNLSWFGNLCLQKVW